MSWLCIRLWCIRRRVLSACTVAGHDGDCGESHALASWAAKRSTPMTLSLRRLEPSWLEAAPVGTFAALHKLAAGLSIALLSASMMSAWFAQTSDANAPPATPAPSRDWLHGDNETVASVYAGVPVYHRSDVHLTRPDATDMTLKGVGWDGDAFYFPIDGGARVIRWFGSFGTMVDFLHNKAVARLGKGAHGRKIRNGVIEDVATEGTLKGQPAPSPLRLTDLVERLEFTHGHNVLMATGLARLFPLAPNIRPYFGIGVGVALPHVEVRFVGEHADRWTSQYQYAGPSLQFLAGIELRSGRGSYYVEYKLIWASISGALTGGKSWSLKDIRPTWLPKWFVEPFSGLTELPGDLLNQFWRWRSGEEPIEGKFETELTSHEIVVGAGYVWPGAAGVPAETAKP